MTALDEKGCRALVWKLCSGLGWNIHSEPGVRYVLLDRAGGWITFGQSMAEIVESLCEHSCAETTDLAALPAWMRECSSIEELAVKAEVAL